MTRTSTTITATTNPKTCTVKVGDQVYCLDRDVAYYVRGFHPTHRDRVLVEMVNLARHPPKYIKVTTLVKYSHGKPRHVHVSSSSRGQVKDLDVKYNHRKDVANAAFWKTFKQIVAHKEVRALLLDAPPRGADMDDKNPNSTEFLVTKKRVSPRHIVVVNPSAKITAALHRLKVHAYTTDFNAFATRHRPDKPFNYLYLDACGAYHTQLRDGLAVMMENHMRWLADEALVYIVICKRGDKHVVDLVKKDMDTWASSYGYGNVLSTLTQPPNPYMHSLTLYLKRHV